MGSNTLHGKRRSFKDYEAGDRSSNESNKTIQMLITKEEWEMAGRQLPEKQMMSTCPRKWAKNSTDALSEHTKSPMTEKNRLRKIFQSRRIEKARNKLQDVSCQKRKKNVDVNTPCKEKSTEPKESKRGIQKLEAVKASGQNGTQYNLLKKAMVQLRNLLNSCYNF